ncbi:MULTISPECIES: VOC family protein [Nostocales]|uniref:Glyoxalase/bleomycin resistance protein/dioxygenase n=3 Tax=Nostocales TaxID=1161 RepID=A0A0C1R834_9CYAN|nr:VOC family protein [Tolypothrix bouteillei]KAF3884692.1 VOC family protein [Tolypothrix bouteillei VB521301]
MQVQDTLEKYQQDNRPSIAIGHVRLAVTDVSKATEFFVKLGLRHITQSDEFAVLELRGGTHLVIRKTSDPISSGTNAPFDLMVDDIITARQTFTEWGLTVSEITIGRVHKSFILTGPDGYLITVTSSHTGGRVV